MADALSNLNTQGFTNATKSQSDEMRTQIKNNNGVLDEGDKNATKSQRLQGAFNKGFISYWRYGDAVSSDPNVVV